MAKIDARYYCVAKAEIGKDGTIAYTGGRKLSDAIAMDESIEYSNGEFYAEGRMKLKLQRVKSASHTFEGDTFDYEAETLLFGHEVSADDEQTANLDDRGEGVGVAYYTEDTDGFYEGVFYPLVTFSESSASYKAYDGNFNFVTPKIEGTINTDDKLNWRKRKRFETALEAVAWVNANLNIGQEVTA
jgi:hypothetical protein